MAVEINKKTFEWGLVIIVILLGLYIGITRFIQLKLNAIYSLGVVEELLVKKGYNWEYSYSFDWRNATYKGIYTSTGKDTRIEIGDKFLVVFSPKNVKNNQLIVDKPVDEAFNIDSLNKLGVDPKDITLWY